jgi:hypothetical protein
MALRLVEVAAITNALMRLETLKSHNRRLKKTAIFEY